MDDAEAEELERRTKLLPSILAVAPPSPWQAMLQPLLSLGPWSGGDSLRIAAGGEERWLVHAGSLISERQNERAVDAFELRASAQGPPLVSLVRKSVWDNAGNLRYGLADEGLFYAAPGRDLKGQRFRLPRLYACSSSPQGVSLVIERVREAAVPFNWATVQSLAAALGELGAKSHAENLHASPVVKPLGQGFQLETADHLMQLAELCLPRSQGASELRDAFFAVFGDADLLRRVREQLKPCICHDDAFRRNMMTPEGEDTIVIVDWGKVRSGFIGHDASLLLLPGMVGSRRLRLGVNFEQAAGRVFRALWKGADEAGAGLVRENARFGFDFALLQGICRFSDRYPTVLTEAQGNASVEELLARKQWMASALEFGRRKAEVLVRRFG